MGEREKVLGEVCWDVGTCGKVCWGVGKVRGGVGKCVGMWGSGAEV